MGICRFNTDDVRLCVKHALQSKNHGMGGSKRPPVPSLFFVYDEGVYLFSNGLDGVGSDNKVYAKGCDPNKDEDFYETARGLVGGDDFAELLPVGDEFLRSCEEFSVMEVRVNTRSMSIVFKKPRLKRAV